MISIVQLIYIVVILLNFVIAFLVLAKGKNNAIRWSYLY